MAENGKVYLVGAGPGDTGLITVKGQQCLKEASVVVYDRLANSRLLSVCRPDAEMIYVGKTPDHHTLKQEEINEVLVEKAQEGKNVVRLKGGDPFVFGRGGEEGERLREAGIAFEVVPGITSAIAVPAYAGIPVTHRNLTSTFTVITGHEDPTKEDSQIDWERLGKDPGTLIFLMGVGHLAQIRAQLVANGKNEQTPVAVIRWGTRPEQRVVTGVLADIEERVREAGITSPAIILVGDVVAMRETLSWFEEKPLFGHRILVTRAREQASVLSEKLEKAGAEAVEAPMIAVKKASNSEPLHQAIAEIESYDWIIFTSVNGVQYFFEALLAQNRDIRDLKGIQLCAIGPKTQEALAEKGLRVNVIPETFVAEGVLAALQPLLTEPQRILLPRSDLARQVLVDTLTQEGHDVTDVVAYETVATNTAVMDLKEKLETGGIHMVTFTSSSTVKNYMTYLKTHAIKPQQVVYASIGPITTKTAEDAGLPIAIEAKTYTIDGLVSAILDYVAADHQVEE